MTGLRAALLPHGTELEAAGVRIARARTFADVPEGELLWYANANGLAEIAARAASAAARLGLAPGCAITVHVPA
jgi:S-adenosyl-L-methionine hydrolase (adenosine-forming)